MAAVTRGRGPGERRFALLTVAPAVIILVALSIFPLVYSLRLSFTDEALLSIQPVHVVGLSNYWDLLHDSLFWSSLVVTLVFAASVITLQLGIGLALALALHRLPRYQQVTVTLLLIPSILSPSVASFQWKQLFDYNGGVLNYLLNLIGVAPQTWTASPTAALPSLVLVDFWEWTPFMVLLLFAGVSTLPESVFEAAKIDGSSSFQILIYQILPLLRRVIAIAVILRLIAAFKIFDIIYVLTAGGPGTSTESLNYYLYVQAFRYFNMGYSAALSFVTLILIIVLAKLILGFMERPVGQVTAVPKPGAEVAAEVR